MLSSICFVEWSINSIKCRSILGGIFFKTCNKNLSFHLTPNRISLKKSSGNKKFYSYDGKNMSYDEEFYSYNGKNLSYDG